MPKRSVNFILETGSLAGGVRVIGELANRLAARGWEVAIWSIHPAKTMAWFPLSRQVEWHSFFQTGTVRDYAQMTAVLSKVRGIKIATFWRTAYTVADASEADEGFYLCQDIETSYTSQPIMAESVMETYVMPLRKITTSRWVQGQLAGDCDYIGIGLDNFWCPQAKWKRLGYPLACLRRQALKGFAELGETARYLAHAGMPMLTFGQDPISPMVAEHHHNMDPRTMKSNGGPLDDKQLRIHYNQAGTFISTSRHEGFSLTPLEAMACGCPVVMTPADGNLEYAVDGENCLLRPTPRAVAEAVLALYHDKDLQTKLAANGKRTAASYRWNDVLDRLEAALS